MKNLILSCILMSTSAFAVTNNQLLQNLCDKYHGKILNQWTCPNDGAVRGGPFCEFNDHFGRKHVVNGCTGTFAGIGASFFPACVIHDFCYHSEPKVSGKTQADCDRNLLADMEDICDREGSGFKCYLLAQTFYDAVRTAGGSSWNCSKDNVDYVRSYLDI